MPGDAGHPWCPLSCRHTPPSSASVLRWPPPCVCLCPNSLFPLSTPVTLIQSRLILQHHILKDPTSHEGRTWGLGLEQVFGGRGDPSHISTLQPPSH